MAFTTTILVDTNIDIIEYFINLMAYATAVKCSGHSFYWQSACACGGERGARASNPLDSVSVSLFIGSDRHSFRRSRLMRGRAERHSAR